MFRSNSEVAIHVPDLARAEAFYAGVLGFRLVTKTADHLELDTGDLRLYVNRDAKTPRSFIPSFDVDNLATAREQLLAAGCEPEPGMSSYYRDPFGFVFDIVERAGQTPRTESGT